MKKVRVEIGAILEVYVEDGQKEQDAFDIATIQTLRLDRDENGVHDPDLYLSNYAVNVIESEEVDCE